MITNGSKIVVPEGFGLILMQDGAITGLAVEPGGGTQWDSGSQDSQLVFAGDGVVSPLIHTSWERFKFGGRPQSQQRALFVSLKELVNNRIHKPPEIYWDDAYLNAQVGAITLVELYSLKITDGSDPIREAVRTGKVPGIGSRSLILPIFTMTPHAAAVLRGHQQPCPGSVAVHE